MGPEMSDDAPTCPDCGVGLERMRLRTAGGGQHHRFVSEENREGILGKLGVKQTYDAASFVCPECGLARLYADLPDDVGESTQATASDESDEEGWTFE